MTDRGALAVDRRRMLTGVGLIALGAVLPMPGYAAEPRAVTKQTLVYAVRDGKPLALDLFKPSSPTGALPVIIFLHGGGWSGGTRTTGPDFGRFFAQDGFAMVSIDYRLVPGITFPANLEDVKTAIRWVRANAAAHGLDGARIALWGTSAGGHLAALAGLTPAGQFEGEDNRDRSSAVACVLDAYGPVLFTTMDREAQAESADLQPIAPGLRGAPAMLGGHVLPPGAAAPAMANGPGRQPHDAPNSAESRLVGAPIQTVPDKVRAASPLSYVRRGAPPFLIMHGMADDAVPHSQSVRLYEALARAGNDVTLRLIDGLPHTFFNRSNLDELIGPARMTVRHSRRGAAARSVIENAKVFDVARGFFAEHLGVRLSK